MEKKQNNKTTATQAEVQKENTIKTEVTKVTKPTVKEIQARIKDDLGVTVESKFHGQLVYVNHKTGDECIWETVGEQQDLTVADLKEMKSNQLGFFKNQWLVITDVDDEDIRPSDVVQKINIGKYMSNVIDVEDTEAICSWSELEIANKVNLLTQGAKANLVIALNDYIESGKIDSLTIIKAFEKALECDLSSSN